jgi:flagellar export protein FliJ
MKPFRFRGARLLEWRRIQEDAVRGEFLRAHESAREAAALVADAEGRAGDAVRDYREALSTGIEAHWLERHRNWIVRQQGDIAASRERHGERKQIADKAADALRVAHRHVRIVERLRQHAWKRYLDAARRIETKEIDELATRQFARRMAAGGPDRER